MYISIAGNAAVYLYNGIAGAYAQISAFKQVRMVDRRSFVTVVSFKLERIVAKLAKFEERSL
jgi:hypothetical protein